MENSMDLQCNKTVGPLNNGDRGVSEKLAAVGGSGCEENTKENCRVDFVRTDSQEAEADGDLDPRIQIELEKLNSSTDVINKLELDLEEARSTFRHLLGESGRQLSQLYKEVGPSVEKSRCYYDARMKARAALSEAQRAAARYEKASSAHDAAKEMVTLAEEGFKEHGVVHFDQAWQEMLNHATKKVNENEVERNLSTEEHRVKSKSYQIAEQKVIALQRAQKRSINRSRPYFEAKARLNQSLDDQKRQIQLIEETIQMTKIGYADSLKELEKISEEIHERRRKETLNNTKTLSEVSSNNHGSGSVATLGTRQAGVGAEFPSPHPSDKLPKQISETRNENKGTEANDCYTHEETGYNPNLGPRSGHKNTSNNQSSKSNPAEKIDTKYAVAVNSDEVDCIPLVGENMSASKKYNSINGKKLRRKKYENLESKRLPGQQLKASRKKKAISATTEKCHIEKSKHSSIETESHSESSEKRKSVSSCSTTESVENDGTSALNSVASNISNSSKCSSRGSSSDTTSSESPSTESSPKLCYERLKSSKKQEDSKFSEFLTNTSSSSLLNTSSKENLGLPIHPFENNLSFELQDSTKSRNIPSDLGKITFSPMKNNFCSPTALTNKFLNIRQEESELSDAESLASLDPLDDSQIDQLMKEASLKKVAEVIMHHPDTELPAISEDENKKSF